MGWIGGALCKSALSSFARSRLCAPARGLADDLSSLRGCPRLCARGSPCHVTKARDGVLVLHDRNGGSWLGRTAVSIVKDEAVGHARTGLRYTDHGSGPLPGDRGIGSGFKTIRL
jgi:hypothetical protein